MGRRHTRRIGAVLLGGALLVTGCTSSSTPPAADAAAQVVEQVLPTTIELSPVSAASDVSPAEPVTVTAQNGTLTEVTLTDGKDRVVPGQLSADGSQWVVEPGTLRLGQKYLITARAVDEQGKETTRTGFFVTVEPRKELTTSISPLDGQTVGVGMPVVVRFSHQVRDRAAVEAALTVTSSKPVEGAWSWVSDEEVHYRPKDYWPTHTKVRVKVGLRSVDAGRGVWGTSNRTIRFETGASMVSVVDVDRHRLTVFRNGKKARVIPVSTGKAGFLTRNGTKVVLEKHTLKVMDASTIGISPGDPEYYRLDVPYALRVTWSGEFVHAAPWSVGSQGRANVSHGCVGMRTSDAIWLFNRTLVGDIIKVKGSPREIEPGNGYTDWNVSWAEWLEGSALPQV
jgi:lipoprotein-anchoring transpeptidase ErfK/SrfK